MARGKRIFHYRNNSGAAVVPATGNYARRFISIGTAGSSDIIAVVNGRYIAVEVKDAKGKQNENQKDFQQRLESAGGLYIVARRLEDVEQIAKMAKAAEVK